MTPVKSACRSPNSQIERISCQQKKSLETLLGLSELLFQTKLDRLGSSQVVTGALWRRIFVGGIEIVIGHFDFSKAQADALLWRAIASARQRIAAN